MVEKKLPINFIFCCVNKDDAIYGSDYENERIVKWEKDAKQSITMSYTSDVIIFWLNTNIGQPNEYQILKEAFSTTLHPDWASSMCVNDNHLNDPIKCNISGKLYSYKSDAIEVYTCSDEDVCLDYLQQNKNKRLFIINTNMSSEHFLFKAIEKYPNVFAKSLEVERISLYLLHTNPAQIKEEFGNNQQNVLIFTNEIALLAHLICAIADYFRIVGQNQLNPENMQDISQGLKYFRWAETLYKRANDFQQPIQVDAHMSIIDNCSDQDADLLEQVRDSNDHIDVSIAFNCTCGSNAVDMTEINQQHGCSFPQETFENISTVLTQFFGESLMILQEEKECDQLLKRTDSPIVVLSLSNDDNELLLDKLCSLTQPPAIYLSGSQPTTVNKRDVFFNKYHSVCDMSNDPQDLAVRIAVDLAMKHRINGDRYGRQQNKNSAQNNYDQCIEILNRLGDFARINVDTTD
ncbi:hypothetical protein I4U23_015636 [Adineta vaga]|nr:hypothetical protein I4U23_015636 [Adineta vaga]